MHKNKTVVATVYRATLKYFIILKKETVENAMTLDKDGHISM